MTIYECLGLDHILMDEQIPIELIIENIDNEDLRNDARIYFNSINRVALRASIVRGEHYLQVVEIDLDRPKYIREISFLIQKAIKYRVLFVFAFEGRYLLISRSFNLTMSTENVYTYAASFCSDWIYEEYLNMDILYSHRFWTVKEYAEADEEVVELLKTNNDNGDYILFRDLLSCAEGLNKCIVESDCISARWFLDWLQFHAVGQRVEIEEIIQSLRKHEAYLYIENLLFFDKSLLKYTLSELDNSWHTLQMDHTGKSPMRYFEDIDHIASYEDVHELFQLIKQDQIYAENSNGLDFEEVEEMPPELKHYCRGNYSGHGIFYVSYTPTLSRSPFVDMIIELYQYRNAHLVKYQDLSTRTLLGLRRAKFTTLEQICLHAYEELEFLPFKNKVELILLLERFGFRLSDCPKDQYPSINDFIKEKIKCKDCGGEIEAYDWKIDNRMCSSCTERHERLDAEKVFNKNVSNVTIHTGEECSRIEMRFSLSTEAIGLDVQLVSAVIFTHSGVELPFDLTSGPALPETVTIKGWKTSEYSLTSGIPAKIFLQDIKFIRCEYITPRTGSKYAFTVKIAQECVGGKIEFRPVPFDYVDYDAEAKKAAEHAAELVRLEEECRLKEEQRKAEEQRRLEEERKMLEEIQERDAEKRRREKAEEQRRLEEERRKAEEQRRLEEERRKAEEQRRHLEEERRKADELRRIEQELARRKESYRAQKLCQHCGGKFKGFFKKVCSHCGRSKDY